MSRLPAPGFSRLKAPGFSKPPSVAAASQGIPRFFTIFN